MSIESLKKEIRKLLDDRNALLLAHNYQIDEIQEIAHHTGDSLGLARVAAESEAEVIVFAGVHFMAESVSILSPQKTVLLPRVEAGCPMADMITPGQVLALKSEHPGGTVVKDRVFVGERQQIQLVAAYAGMSLIRDVCAGRQS